MAYPLLYPRMDLLCGSGNGEEVKSMTNSHSPASNSTIMVVDDNPELVELVCVMLETKGYNVMYANSGKELLAGLEKQKPDLILLDVMMREMDGLEVLERLRGNPDTASIPVILLTAKVHHEDVQRGYKLGADYYIKKPFDRFKLLASINLLLGVRDRRTAKRFAQVCASNLAGQNWLKRGDIKDSISIS